MQIEVIILYTTLIPRSFLLFRLGLLPLLRFSEFSPNVRGSLPHENPPRKCRRKWRKESTTTGRSIVANQNILFENTRYETRKLVRTLFVQNRTFPRTGPNEWCTKNGSRSTLLIGEEKFDSNVAFWELVFTLQSNFNQFVRFIISF